MISSAAFGGSSDALPDRDRQRLTEYQGVGVRRAWQRRVPREAKALRPNDTPRPGVVEHPDDDIWFSIGEASRRAMAGLPGEPADIVGVGLCTIRFCRALLEERTGRWQAR